MKFAAAIVVSLGLAGCADTGISSAVQASNQQMEAKGSPFRYVAQDGSSMTLTLMPLPEGPTRAVPALEQKVMDAIAGEETRQKRSTASLERVHYLQDGREVWVLNTLGSGIAYVVALENPADPDSNVRLTGPTVYLKK
jgi:hypothetical protein